MPWRQPRQLPGPSTTPGWQSELANTTLAAAYLLLGDPSPANLILRWTGTTLHIRAQDLGCAPFTNHPILIDLAHPLKTLLVTASAAL